MRWLSVAFMLVCPILIGFRQSLSLIHIYKYFANVPHWLQDGKYGFDRLFHDKPSTPQTLLAHSADKWRPCEYATFLPNKVPTLPMHRHDSSNVH